MMTPRGVEDVHVYTPERVIARLGIPPAAVPDYIGLKGDTGDDIQGVPGIGDKTAVDLLRCSARSRASTRTSTEVAGAEAHGDAGRARGAGARVEGARHDRAQPAGARGHRPRPRSCRPAPDRSALKEQFRRWSSAACCARMDELEDARAVAAARGERHRGRLAPGDAGRAARRARRARRAPAWRGRRAARRRGARRTRCWWSTATPDELAAVAGRRPRDRRPRLQGAAARAACARAWPVAFDTFLAAYLIEPEPLGLHGRGDCWTTPAIELEVQAEEETAALVRSRARRAARCASGWPPRLEERGRHAPAGRHRAAAGRRAGGDGGRRRRASTRTCWPRSRARVADEVEPSSSDGAYELAGGQFAIGSPKQLGEVLFERLGLPADRKGKTGYSTDQRVLAQDPRPAPDRGRRRALARAHEAALHLPDAAARGDRRATAASTRRSRRPRPPPAGSRARTRTCRTSRCARRSAARSAAPSCRADGTRLLSADYSQVELRILAHLSGEEVLRRARSSAGRTCTARRPPRCSASPPTS